MVRFERVQNVLMALAGIGNPDQRLGINLSLVWDCVESGMIPVKNHRRAGLWVTFCTLLRFGIGTCSGSWFKGSDLQI